MQGHTAGVAAALAALAEGGGVAVHDVDRARLAAVLLSQGQILSAKQLPGGGNEPAARGKVGYVCARDRCFQSLHASPSTNGSSCEQTKPPSEKCSPLKPAEWLGLKQHW